MSAVVVLEIRGDGEMDVVQSPPVVAFEARLFDGLGIWAPSVSLTDGIVRCGSLLGKQAWYRLVDVDERGGKYIGELIAVHQPWAR